MNISMSKNASALTVKLEGRLDTSTSPVFEKSLQENLNSVREIVMDFAGIEYISSAGLRVLLSAQKHMNAAGGSMKLLNVNESVMEVFDITGFADILTIE